MNAQYYYLDADGETVHGPFGLADIWAMQERGVLTAQSKVCRAGSDVWEDLAAYPELKLVRPEDRESALPPSIDPPPRRPGEISAGTFFGVIFLAIVLYAGYYLSVQNGKSNTASSRRVHNFQIWVRGTEGLNFSGSFGADGQSRTVTGTVPADYSLSGAGCVAVLQKQTPNGLLNVSIISDNERAAEQSSSSAYGVVQVSAP